MNPDRTIGCRSAIFRARKIHRHTLLGHGKASRLTGDRHTHIVPGRRRQETKSIIIYAPGKSRGLRGEDGSRSGADR
jgi:hypothetical protein